MTVDQTPVRVVIAGGGTGGHVQPAIAVSGTLRERAQVDLNWIGSATGVERDVAEERGIPFWTIPVGKLRRYLSLYTVTDALRIPFGILRARLLLRRLQPDVLYSTGGFVSVPTVVAAWLAGIPVITHEQTATVGLANRINARFARRIALAYATTADDLNRYRDRIVITGNPVRPDLIEGDAARARQRYSFPDDMPLVYITGGSLGAQAINGQVRAAIADLLDRACVVHQCGPASMNGDLPRLLEARARLPEHLQARYVIQERIGGELADIYAAASLVVGRAGAGTIAELALLGKPSILIPLPGSASDEQRRNAEVLASAGAAIHIPQSELTPHRLVDEVTGLLDHPEDLDRMAAAARGVAQPDAARLLADEVIALARS